MLPKIDVPVYEIHLPVCNKTMKYRPFLVKEEKLLLMAMESNEDKTIIDSIKQIINNCCLDEIDVETIPVPDLEYFFLNLRARSVSEIVELKYKCNNTVRDENGEDKTCGNVVSLELKVLEVKPEISPEHSNKIELTEKMGIVMKYPNFKMMEKLENSKTESEVEKLMSVISECIDYIYDTDTVYYKKDIETKELTEFIEGLNRNQFEKIQKFFETMPKMKKELRFQCKKCGYDDNIVVEGLQNFFV
jgi:hypothetical protein